MKSIIAITALAATTAASNLVQRDNVEWNASCITSQPYAKVVNRCSYPVYLWSVAKEMGCSAGEGVTLKTGEFYHENYRNDADGGVSIKLSKFNTCGGKDITQLEYKIDAAGAYAGNYLDMSFVDCTSNLEDCPGRTDGFYLKSGNEGGIHVSEVDNEHCPIFSVTDSTEAAAVSYVKWDDRQTKYCSAEANLQLFLCGGDAPSADDDTPYASAAPSSSSEVESKSTPQPTSSAQPISSAQPTSSIIIISSSTKKAPAPSSTEEAYVVAAAAAEVTPAPSAPAVKTEVVYVTEYVNKRHAHGRRHQHFHA